MEKVVKWFLIFLMTIAVIACAYFVIASSETINGAPQEKVVYNLPYPGILPDHPLYFLKIIRDRVSDFLTRDYLKKAELYLLYSDKRAAMAVSLAKKGKNQQAIDTFSKAEKYFLKIPPILQEAKKQGSAAPSSFVDTLKLSNAKHQELITKLLKTLPQGITDSLNQIMLLNLQVKKELEKL